MKSNLFRETVELFLISRFSHIKGVYFTGGDGGEK